MACSLFRDLRNQRQVAAHGLSGGADPWKAARARLHQEPALLEIGKESVYGAGLDELMDEAATELIAEAMAEFTDDDPVPELPL